MHARRWEALLVVMDNKPFGDLHQILQEVADDRIWVFAEWVSSPRRHPALGCVDAFQSDECAPLLRCEGWGRLHSQDRRTVDGRVP